MADAKTTKSTKTTKKSTKAAKQKDAKPATAQQDKKAKATSPTHSYTNLAIVLSAVAIVCSGFSMATTFGNFSTNLTGQLTSFLDNSYDGNSATFTDASISDIAEKVSPSVVSIVTEVRSESWFGQVSTGSSAGTGVIISKDGYIITNKHVIECAEKISVVLDNGTTYESGEVELIGTDPSNDVAFLKIKGATDLPYSELGDSKTLKVGQRVLAIGNALGQFQNTVTEGIISGTGRAITASDNSGSNAENLTDMLQTDASINAGNSGGPLVNAAGQVIGINTAVSSNAQGIGFAIPISSIKGLLKSILATGEANRAYLGVYYTTLTPSVAKNNSLSVSHGAYVHNNSGGTAIIQNSPAEKAGIKDGDIITKVGKTEVGSAGSLATLIGEYAVGDTVQLTINREDTEITLDVTLETYPTSVKKS